MSDDMTNDEFRKHARNGALLMCIRAITEFPDILAELNNIAKGEESRLDSPATLKKLFPLPGKKTREKAHPGDFRPLPKSLPRKVLAVRRNGWTPAKRKAHSLMMKKRWAARKRATQ
jgi:hypothetical protein